MKRLASVFLLLILFAQVISAAQVFGNLKVDDKSVGSGVELRITCGDMLHKATTDAYGSYNVFLPTSGRCWVKVFYQGQESQAYRIFSSSDPTRYDFDLQRLGDGSFVLKRR